MAIAEVTVAERRTLRVPFPASTAIAVGDLLWWDNSAKFGKRASARTDTGSVGGNQADFKPLFFGVAGDQRLSTETSVTVVATKPTGDSDRLVITEGIFDCDCASATFEFGDLIGVARDGTPLNYNQQVIGVAATAPNLAIGFCVKREPAAVTKVRCFLSSILYGWFAQLAGLGILGGTTTTAGGATKPVAAIGITGTAGLPAIGVYWGSGAPTISAPQGSLYFRTDGSSTSTRLYINTTGSTTWTNVTTAA